MIKRRIEAIKMIEGATQKIYDFKIFLIYNSLVNPYLFLIAKFFLYS